MKLQELHEAKSLSFEMPSAAEITAAKHRYQETVRAGRLFHVTSERTVPRIMKTGLRAPAYFAFGEPNWDGEVNLVVQGKDVADNIYPDPEHLIDSVKFNELFKSTGAVWGFKQVMKQIDKDLLCWLHYDLCKQEDWPEDLQASWMICLEPVPPEYIKEE